MPDIIFRIGDQPYTGWEEIHITRSIERMSGQFELVISQLPVDWKTALRSREVFFEIDGQIILSGFNDRVRPQYEPVA